MFNQSKYTSWYFSIIENARVRKKPECYGERHHVIPKSLGGPNRRNNLVFLTGREHLICHLLLFRMMIDPEHKLKMGRALSMMLAENKHTRGRTKVSGRLYQMIREAASKSTVLRDPKIRFNPSRDATDEYRDNMSEKMIGRQVPWRHGAKDSDETRAKKSESGKTKVFTEKHLANLARAAKERWAKKRAQKESA